MSKPEVVTTKIETLHTLRLTPEQQATVGPLVTGGGRKIEGVVEEILILDRWAEGGRRTFYRQTVPSEVDVTVRHASGSAETVPLSGTFTYDTRERILEIVDDTPRPTTAKVKFS